MYNYHLFSFIDFLFSSIVYIHISVLYFHFPQYAISDVFLITFGILTLRHNRWMILYIYLAHRSVQLFSNKPAAEGNKDESHFTTM